MIFCQRALLLTHFFFFFTWCIPAMTQSRPSTQHESQTHHNTTTQPTMSRLQNCGSARCRHRTTSIHLPPPGHRSHPGRRTGTGTRSVYSRTLTPAPTGRSPVGTRRWNVAAFDTDSNKGKRRQTRRERGRRSPGKQRTATGPGFAPLKPGGQHARDA